MQHPDEESDRLTILTCCECRKRCLNKDLVGEIRINQHQTAYGPTVSHWGKVCAHCVASLQDACVKPMRKRGRRKKIAQAS